MEKLMNELNELQKRLQLDTDVADESSANIDCLIASTEKRTKELKIKREDVRAEWLPGIQKLTEEIVNKKVEILDEWNGEEKTIRSGNLVMKMRTTKKTIIGNKADLLEDIIKRTSILEAANKYINGFKLTPVRAYMSVHELPEAIAYLESNTSVTLKEE